MADLLHQGELAKLQVKSTDLLDDTAKRYWPNDLKRLLVRLIDDLGQPYARNDEVLSEMIEQGKERIVLSGRYADAVRIFNELVDSIYNRGLRTESRKYRKEIHEIIAIVEENIDKKISLAMIAQRINMTETYLCKLFKKETGKNLVSFINDLKIERAIELLRDEDFSIGEVAASVGFDDQFYFSRIFKKYAGLSPSEYRAKQLTNQILNPMIDPISDKISEKHK